MTVGRSSFVSTPFIFPDFKPLSLSLLPRTISLNALSGCNIEHSKAAARLHFVGSSEASNIF